MAESKVPSFQVKHVDGVMHLTLQPKHDAPVVPELLRVQPPANDEA